MYAKIARAMGISGERVRQFARQIGVEVPRCACGRQLLSDASRAAGQCCKCKRTERCLRTCDCGRPARAVPCAICKVKAKRRTPEGAARNRARVKEWRERQLADPVLREEFKRKIRERNAKAAARRRKR